MNAKSISYLEVETTATTLTLFLCKSYNTSSCDEGIPNDPSAKKLGRKNNTVEMKVMMHYE